MQDAVVLDDDEPLVVELEEPDELLELSPDPPHEARNAAAPPEANQVSIWRRCRMRSM
jgi:hypothetical protein